MADYQNLAMPYDPGNPQMNQQLGQGPQGPMPVQQGQEGQGQQIPSGDQIAQEGTYAQGSAPVGNQQYPSTPQQDPNLAGSTRPVSSQAGQGMTQQPPIQGGQETGQLGSTLPAGGYADPNMPVPQPHPPMDDPSGGYMQGGAPPSYTPPPGYTGSKKRSPFCWCCCFVILLIIVGVLGLGIYAYYTETEIPLISDFLGLVEEQMGEDTTEGEDQEEVTSPFLEEGSYEGWEEYEMSDFDLSLKLPSEWIFKEISTSEVTAKTLKSWLREGDLYEDSEKLEPVKYKVSKSNEAIEIGIIYDLEKGCKLTTAKPDEYKCYDIDYEFEVDDVEITCSATLDMIKDEDYDTSDPYDLFSCNVTLSGDSIWKKVVIFSSTLSDDDLQTNETEMIIESIGSLSE